LVLIATKTDLRTDPRALDLLKAQGRHPVTTMEGQAVAKRIGAKYAEVSAITGQGVEEVFDLALKEAMKGRGIGGSSGGGGYGGGNRGRMGKRKVKCTVL